MPATLEVARLEIPQPADPVGPVVPTPAPEIAPDPGVSPGVADPVGPEVPDPVPPDESPAPAPADVPPPNEG